MNNGMAMNKLSKEQVVPFAVGVGMTFLIALISKYLASFPFLSIMGQLVVAILLGMLWRAVIGVQERVQSGISFSSSKLLRLGIILLGMRLNLADIYHAGMNVFLLALIYLIGALFLVYGIARMFGVDDQLGLLTACGTAICGAAAVVAISPQVKATKDQTAVGVATIAILGTIFTLIYTFMYPILNLSPAQYGTFAGATLHEIAHVIAAADPAGDKAVDMAVIVKLTRVALLVPVALMIGLLARRKQSTSDERKRTFSSIPWFIFGFLAMSSIHSLGVVPESIATNLVNVAYTLLAMAMAGLGLNVQFRTFRSLGGKPFVAGMLGSFILSIVSYGLVIWM